MKIILTADVPNLGAPGDIVEVKDGYGRNYLLPRKMAIVATRGAEKQVEHDPARAAGAADPRPRPRQGGRRRARQAHLHGEGQGRRRLRPALRLDHGGRNRDGIYSDFAFAFPLGEARPAPGGGGGRIIEQFDGWRGFVHGRLRNLLVWCLVGGRGRVPLLAVEASHHRREVFQLVVGHLDVRKAVARRVLHCATASAMVRAFLAPGPSAADAVRGWGAITQVQVKQRAGQLDSAKRVPAAARTQPILSSSGASCGWALRRPFARRRDDLGHAAGQGEQAAAGAADQQRRRRPARPARRPGHPVHLVILAGERDLLGGEDPLDDLHRLFDLAHPGAGRAPRRPSGSNSLGVPAPRPSSTRPPERACSVAIHGLTVRGWRKPMAKTKLPTWSVCVTAAAVASAVRGARPANPGRSASKSVA